MIRVDGKVITSNGKPQSEKAYRNFLDYRKEYDKARYRRYTFRLVSSKEPEAIKFLESHAEVNGYLRSLINADFKKQVEAGHYNPETGEWAPDTQEYKDNMIQKEDEKRREAIVEKLNEKYRKQEEEEKNKNNG